MNGVKMQHKIIVILALAFTAPIQAEKLERLTITSCAYQAGTAREIQTIRQSEGDDWSQFEQKILTIYGEGQGRTDLLAIAKRVYLQSFNMSPDEIHIDMFDACVKRVNGTEPSA
jgi:hypothetical protein